MKISGRLERIFRPRDAHEPLRHAIRHELPFLLLISLLTLGLELAGWLRGFETYALDSLLMLSTHAKASPVQIVAIDDEDYAEHFGGASPIDPDALARVLEVVAAAGPRLIAVDLDTSSERFKDRAWPQNMVWARDGYVPAEGADDNPKHAGHEQPVVRMPILGGQMSEQVEHEHIATTPPSGLVLFPLDFDGVVRRYQRLYESHAEAHASKSAKGLVDSFPWAIVSHYAEATLHSKTADPAERKQCERIRQSTGQHEFLLNFTGDQYRPNRLPVHVLLEAGKKDNWADNSPLKNSIVIVGGTYRAARDEYATPVGPRYGVDLIALAVDAELRGRGIGEVNLLLACLCDLLAGLLFIYLNWRFPGGTGAWVSLVALFLLPPIASWVAFKALAYWFNFSAVLVALWIHLLWNQSRERRAMRAELERHRARAAQSA